MTRIDILKQALTYVSAAGVREMITNVVKSTTPICVSPIQRFSISTATVVLTSMVTDQMAKHIDEKIDEIQQKIMDYKEEIENGRE